MQIDIKTAVDLEKFCHELEKAGFGFKINYQSKMLESKLQSIVRAANPLNVEYNFDILKKQYFQNGVFADFQKGVEEYFSQFDTRYKQLETVEKYALLDCIWVSGSNGEKIWEEYIGKGYQPLPNTSGEKKWAFGVYDFSKPATKTKFRFSDNSFGINRVLEALGADWECPYFSDFRGNYPDNENIKVFKNGNVLIHDEKIASLLLELLKEKYVKGHYIGLYK